MEEMHGEVGVRGQRPFFSVISMMSAASVLDFLGLQPQNMWPIGWQKKDPARGRQTRGWSACADHDGRGSGACRLQPDSRGTSPSMTVERMRLAGLTATLVRVA